MCAKTLTQPIKPYPKEKTLSQKVAEARKQARQQTISNWGQI
jgi:hypothetical protein